MDLNDYTDASGAHPEPSDNGWTWDRESLVIGAYTGFKLYLVLRDRLTTLAIPAVAHNKIIEEMVNEHDETLLDAGAGLSTLLMVDEPDSDYIPMAILGGREFSLKLKDL